MNTDNSLLLLQRALREARTQDDVQFYRLLRTGVSILKLTEEDIAHQFGASRPTVKRWLAGTSAPHPAVRRPVYDWLLGQTAKARSVQ